MPLSYRDGFVQRLFDDIGALICGDGTLGASVEQRLCELATENAPELATYWRNAGGKRGVPDTAFRSACPPYWFPDQPPQRVFRTSGTSGGERGQVFCSPLGLELMNESICAQAKAWMLDGLEHPAIVRLVPGEADAPEMIMAYGMELIARRFGHPDLSSSVITARGVDLQRLTSILDTACDAQIPVLLIGGSFAFVNVCDALEARGQRWWLASGSRAIDAGGFKGRSREVTVDGLRRMVARNFGIVPERCANLFGMSELASQLYDAADIPVGPLGERPKANTDFVRLRLRDPWTMANCDSGYGLIELSDLCILDRPFVILSGDIGIGSPHGIAVIGRAQRHESRGCSLALQDIRILEGGA